MAQRRLEVIMAGDVKGAQKAFDDTEKGAGGLGDKIKSSLGGAASMVAEHALAAGIGVAAGVTAALKGAYAAAEESAKISRETERVISTTGGAAGVTADHVSDLAGHISELTGADDELVQSNANLLLTFTNVKNEVGAGNDVFDQATSLSLDMATALGTDASGAAIQLGKALNDPVKGITALSKAGVSFTEEQKTQIKTMVEAGDVLGAQKIVLAELSKEFGGAAESAGTPLEKLMVKLGNLQEAFGAHLIPVVDAVATKIGEVLPAAIDTGTAFLSDHIEAVKYLATVGLVALAGAYGPVAAAQLAMVATNVAGWATSAAIYVAGLASVFLETATAEGVLTAATAALELTALPVTAAVLALSAVVYGFANAGQEGEKAANKFVEGLDVQSFSLRSVREGLSATSVKMDEVGHRATSAGDRMMGIVDVIVPWHDVANSVEDARGEYEKFKETNSNWQQILDSSNATLDRTIEKLNAQAAASGKGADMTEALRSKLEAIAESKQIDLTKPGAVQALMGLYDATTRVSTSTLGMSEAQEKFNDAAATAKDKTDAFKMSLDSLTGAHLSAAQAETQYSSNSINLLKTLAENHALAAGKTDEHKASSLAQTAAINESNTAIQGNVKAALDLANATYAETGSLSTASYALAVNRQHLIDTMVQTGYTRDAATAYIDRLGLTPANIHTTATLNTVPAQVALSQYEQLLANFKARGGITSVLGGSITAVEHRAAGGPVAGGAPYLVGENGPEMFVPGRSGTIVPNGSMGGPTVNVVVNGYVGSEDELGRAIIRHLEGAVRRGARSSVLVGAG